MKNDHKWPSVHRVVWKDTQNLSTSKCLMLNVIKLVVSLQIKHALSITKVVIQLNCAGRVQENQLWSTLRHLCSSEPVHMTPASSLIWLISLYEIIKQHRDDHKSIENAILWLLTVLLFIPLPRDKFNLLGPFILLYLMALLHCQ